MKKYRKRPVVIEAMEITEQTEQAVIKWAGSDVIIASPYNLGGVYWQVRTLEGVMTCISGDFIIKGVKGEFYPCRKDIFLETYEVVG